MGRTPEGSGRSLRLRRVLGNQTWPTVRSSKTTKAKKAHQMLDTGLVWVYRMYNNVESVG